MNALIRNGRATRRSSFLACGLGLALLGGAWQAHAATLTVTTTSDAYLPDGVCTLREAITWINNNGPLWGDCPNNGPAYGVGNQIVFNIAGPGVHTIVPTSPLPLLQRTMIVNGYSQPGASPNILSSGWDGVIRIELDGSGL